MSFNINIFKTCHIDIDIDVDIFQIVPIDIDTDIYIFKNGLICNTFSFKCIYTTTNDECMCQQYQCEYLGKAELNLAELGLI